MTRLASRERAAQRRNNTAMAIGYIEQARVLLVAATAKIERAEEFAGAVVGDEATLLGCFASNTLQGSLSLLRELEAKVRRPQGKRSR